MEKKDWYKVEIRELIRENLGKIHRKVGDSYGIDVSFLHKMISEYTKQLEQEAERRGREKLVREIREAIREDVLIDDTEDKHISIDEDIVRIINDKEITGMYLDGEKELRNGGWGWYS